MIFHFFLHAEVPIFNEKIKNSQGEFGCALYKIHPIWIGILGLGIFKYKLVNKKSFLLGEWKESQTSGVIPTGMSPPPPPTPVYSFLRQGWRRVWTSISTAVRFPKKTTDKNITWILDCFWKVSALLKKCFGNCKGLNSDPACLLPLKGETAFSLQPILWISIVPVRAGRRVLLSFGVLHLLKGNLIFKTSK